MKKEAAIKEVSDLIDSIQCELDDLCDEQHDLENEYQDATKKNHKFSQSVIS